MAALGRFLVHSAIGVHLLATLLAGVMGAGLEVPTTTALMLCALLVVYDRTIFVVYPALLLLAQLFLAPTVYLDLQVSLYLFRGDDVYNDAMMQAWLWFIGLFAFYIFGLPRVHGLNRAHFTVERTDVMPVIAGTMLVAFSLIMLRNGTILTSTYAEVATAGERLSFVDISALFTLIGFTCARSRMALRFLLICAVIYMIATLLVGLRLRFLSVAIVTFSCLVGTSIRPSWKVAGLVIALLLIAIGFVRQTSVIQAASGIEWQLQMAFGRGAVTSTFGGAFQSSKYYAYYIDTVSSIQGLNGAHFLAGDILSIFLTRGGTPGDIEIKTATLEVFNIPGGGMLPGFFFAYFGVIGAVILSAIFMALFIWVMCLRGRIFNAYKILLVAYAPRTLFYDWVMAFKMMFLFSIVMILVKLAGRATRSMAGRDTMAGSRPFG